MYTLKKSYFVLTPSTYVPSYWVSHDALHKDTTKKILKQYIFDAHRIFLERLNVLINLNSSIDENKEKHLRRMLDLLIDARKAWDSEHLQ